MNSSGTIHLVEKAQFEILVTETVNSLPVEFQKKLDNVAIIVDDFPTPDQLASVQLHAGQGLLFGLYQGVPKTHRGGNYTFVVPDRITIFQKPIEYVSRTQEGIKEKIRETVLHEIGHYFGMSEGDIHRAQRAAKLKK